MSKFFRADETPNGVVTVTKTIDGKWAGSIYLHPDRDRFLANIFEIDALRSDGFLAETRMDREVLSEARRKFKDLSDGLR